MLLYCALLTKAYQNQYETGIFMVGDRDFLLLIEAMKNVGKKTLCFSHETDCSVDLLRCFDMRIPFEKEAIESWLK